MVTSIESLLAATAMGEEAYNQGLQDGNVCMAVAFRALGVKEIDTGFIQDRKADTWNGGQFLTRFGFEIASVLNITGTTSLEEMEQYLQNPVRHAQQLGFLINDLEPERLAPGILFFLTKGPIRHVSAAFSAADFDQEEAEALTFSSENEMLIIENRHLVNIDKPDLLNGLNNFVRQGHSVWLAKLART